MVMHNLFASYVMYICTMNSHDFNYFFFLFPAVLPDRYNLDSHHIIGRSHLFHEPGFSEGDSILQVGSSFVHIQIHLKNIYFCSICMHIFFFVSLQTYSCISNWSFEFLLNNYVL